MNHTKNHIAFVAAITFVVFVIGGLIYYQESIIQEGTSTILATRPVDPRDLFRGEYVILRYAIENDEKVQAVVKGMQEGSTVFVTLDENEDGVATVGEVTIEAPRTLDGLWIVGEVRRDRVRFPSIEQFYVPEGAGRPIEDLRSNLHVEIVLKDGEARVTKLLDASLHEIDPGSYLE